MACGLQALLQLDIPVFFETDFKGSNQPYRLAGEVKPLNPLKGKLSRGDILIFLLEGNLERFTC